MTVLDSPTTEINGETLHDDGRGRRFAVPTTTEEPSAGPAAARRRVDSLLVIWLQSLLITALVGGAAVALSFQSLADLASREQMYSQKLSYLWPGLVDGTIMLATMALVLLAARGDVPRQHRQFYWVVLGTASVVSIGGNIADHLLAHNVSLPVWLIVIIAAVPPCSVLADVHGAMILGRLRAANTLPGNGWRAAGLVSPGAYQDATAVLIKHRNPDVKCIAERSVAEISEILGMVDEGQSQRSIKRLTGVSHHRIIGTIAKAAAEVRGEGIELDDDRDDD
jgi:hypothetical protein